MAAIRNSGVWAYVRHGRGVHWYGFAAGLTVLLVHNAIIQPWTLDDSFITFRYAENVAAGHGPVYNPGEHVEGYTNFLWMALLAIGRLVVDDLDTLSKVLGTALAIGTMLLVANAHRVLPVTRGASGLAAFLLGTTGIFSVWVMSGMEPPLVAFCVSSAVLLHMHARMHPDDQRPTYAAGLACVLAAMARPECVLVFGMLFLDRVQLSIRRRDYAWFHFAAVFVGVYGSYFAWRFWYYGYLFPNTFYVKVGGTEAQRAKGWEYVGLIYRPNRDRTPEAVQAWLDYLLPANWAQLGAFHGFARTAGLIVAAAIGSLLTAAWRPRLRPVLVVIAALLGLHAAYVVQVGGDIMPAYRFFAPYMPLYCVLAGIGLMALRPRFLAAGLAVVIAAFGVYEMRYNVSVWDQVIKGTVAKSGKLSGTWLREHMPPDTLLTTNTAGSVAYYSGLRVIDTLGLNDEHIAHRKVPDMGRRFTGHEKGHGAYVLSREPDVVMFSSAMGARRPRSFRGDQELAASSFFQKHYTLEAHAVAPGRILHVFRRNPDAPRGAQQAYFEPPPARASGEFEQAP